MLERIKHEKTIDVYSDLKFVTGFFFYKIICENSEFVLCEKMW